MFREIITKGIGLYALDKFKHTNVQQYLKLYRDSTNWSRDRIENYQVQRIRELLKYASTFTEFYKKRFDESGFNYETFRYLDELEKFPILTRKDLQENLSGLTSQNIDMSKCKKGSSSGSTGTPVIYYNDANEISSSKAALMFCKILGGYNTGDKWINIWGNPTAVNVDWKKFSSKVSKFLFNEIRFPAYRLNSESEFEKLIKLILKTEPRYVYGYTNAIYLLAEHLKKNNIRIDFIKGVFTTAENLHEYQRKIIGEYISRVFDQYGSSEINAVATETLNESYYSIIAPRVHVEYSEIADNSTGARKILVTSFENKVLPFIRYENGDLAVPEEDSEINVKIPFPKFKSVEGRVSDIIKLPSGGSLVVPSFFGSRMLKNINGVVQYQVVKTNHNMIEINLVTNNLFKVEYKDVIINTLEEYIPKEMKYKLVFDQPIIISKNNKFKLFVDQSNLHHE